MRFAVISDTHFFAKSGRKAGLWWNRTLPSRSIEVGECLVESLAALSPDFVIHCGDITGHCDMENWRAGIEIMDRLPCPWYGVVGNHDTWFAGVREAFSERFGSPAGRCYYTRRIGDMLFIFLDTCYWEAVDGSVSPYLDKELYDTGRIQGMCIPREEIGWLREELDAHQDETICLVSHAPLGFKPRYPVATMPNGQPGKRGGMSLSEVTYGAGKRLGDVANRLDVRRVLSTHGNVRLALAGHVHINDVHPEDGIAFIQTAAMREWPFEFRMIEIHDDTLTMTTHGLKDPTFKAESFIEEWGNSWVAGGPSDRTFSTTL